MKDLLNRVYVETHGCSTNFADGEVIAGCLSKAGYEISNTIEDAEALVYNTCAVKMTTENRMISLLKKAPKDKKLIVTGCLPLINFERLKSEINFDAALGPAPGTGIVDALEKVKRGQKIIDLKNDLKPPCLLPKIFGNRVISIVPVSYGCLGSCSYCCVRHARGKLRSYSVEDVLARIKRDLDLEAKEVWLSSQDIGTYGRDIEENLANLLNRVVELKGEFYVRVGMMNPNSALEILDELVEAYVDPKIFKFLHIPVQSGDDEVLRRMNRPYTVEDFNEVVESFRKRMPRITLSTDIICGFPGESGEAFESSLRLLKEVEPDILNLSKFSVRPNTPARNAMQIPQKTIKERSKRIGEKHKEIALEKNRKWLNWKGPILVDEHKNGSWIGRNFAYKPITLKTEEELEGRVRIIQIKQAYPTYLAAEIAR